MKNKILISIITCLIALASCTNSATDTTVKTKSYLPVKVYKHQNANNDWVYIYLMMSSLNGSNNYYYYESSSPLTSYSSVVWQQSNEEPTELSTNSELVETQEIAATELAPDMQDNFDNGDYFEGMGNNDMGDYEGGSSSNVDQEQSTDNDNSSDNSSDKSSDGGSDGGGGGDGGDGGGGGE